MGERQSKNHGQLKPDYINLNNAIRFSLGHISMDEQLGAYYQDYSSAIKNYESRQFGQFDEGGLPMDDFGDRALYNPIYIIQYGIIQHDFLLSNHEKKSELAFKSVLDWIVENRKGFRDSCVWPSPKKNAKYGLDEGWVSGMYQGQAISVLLRGYQYFNDLTYLNFAKEAFSFFEYSYEQGGTSRLDAEGNFWIEEYPSKQPSFVLNGFIYALFGILDYYRVTKDHEAKMYIDKMYSTLKNCLHKYDRGYWSVYDQLKEELVSPYYQINIHAAQMQVLFELTDEEIFQYYSKKWTSNYHNRLYRQILVPIMYRVQPRIKKWL